MAEATKVPVDTEKKSTSAAAPPAPWRPFESLRREIDRVFEGFNQGAWRFPFGPSALELTWPREGAWAMAPAVDVAEREKEFEITVELPGMEEKDIEIKLSNGTLSIKGEKKEEKEERKKDYYLSERRYGSFMRAFQVPDGVDAAKIEATFAKGVLTVKLPKTAEAPKNEQKIAVKAG
ncbi:MAG: Hsp20/alpha crystallin family protein [Alphaproteobacteria bacterium]|nr:Hsp20/alpha crystallin family protein [Alphaproteobacteria bacterium]